MSGQRAVVTERRRAFFTEQAMKLVIQCMPWLQGHGSEEDEMGLACTSYWTHSDQTAGQTKRPKECVARCCKHFVQAKILVPPPPQGGNRHLGPKRGAHFAPPFGKPPPPPKGGNRHLGPESIGNTRRRRRQRKFLQGAEADLHCDTMVQICGAVPPPPQGEDRHFVTPPPP